MTYRSEMHLKIQHIFKMRLRLIALLKECCVCKLRTCCGREFQTSGPLCLIDLWANVLRGLTKCIFEACLVEYEWTALLDWNIEEKESGSSSVLKRNIKIAVWRKFMSSTFKHFNLTNNGFVWSRKPDRVHTRISFFCRRRILLVTVLHVAHKILQYEM